MSIRCQIYLSGEHRAEIQAARIDVGEDRLGFYDEKEHLIGLFRWDNIQGFSVLGSADDQTVVEDLRYQIETVGEVEATPIIAAIGQAERALAWVNAELLSAWGKLYHSRRNKSERQQTLSNYSEQVACKQQYLADHQQSVNAAVVRLTDEIRSLLNKDEPDWASNSRIGSIPRSHSASLSLPAKLENAER